MDGLTQKIISGNSAALQMVKTALTTPTLININPDQGMPYALPLECETFEQSGSAQVSESLLIIKNGKKNITDNVAPGSWTWDISGYIPGNKLLEVTNFYTPFVRLNTDILQQWFEKGAVLKFKDMDNRFHSNVVIQNLRVSHQKDCANAAPFTMTIKELNVVQNGDEAAQNANLKSLAKAGSILGTAAKVGMVMTSQVMTPVSLLI